MIETRIGNVLDIPEGIIVHGCNCHGVMGAGIACQIKNRFPEAYKVYRENHESHKHNVVPFGFSGLKLGEITHVEVAPFKIIVNANTQFDMGSDKRYVDYEAIAKCFEHVKQLAQTVASDNSGRKLDICFPLIGAGLAGGNWNIISTIIDETIGDDFNKILYKFQ